ncbi:MAG: hypothetical protein KC503_15775 [Myxococcales bacterium]|nr:hypothetical protein [Myxococcales bacterium]
MRFVEQERSFPARREHVHGERFAALLDAADLTRPLGAIPAVVVAGSAGKASTARMIASIARAALDRVGIGRPIVLGTKPPLHETPDGHRERYQCLPPGLSLPRDSDALTSAWARACWIDRTAFAEHVDALRSTVDTLEARIGRRLAPYDLRYAILARMARTEGAALAVVEANIGLVDDVARRWPGQRVNVLTRIAAEHVALLEAPAAFASAHAALGSLAGPLWHKAGGVASGAAVVIGPQERGVTSVARTLALAAGAREVLRVDERCTISRCRTHLSGTSALLSIGGDATPISLSALGAFQLDNARAAAIACEALAALGFLPPIDAASLQEGLRRVVVPGRLERVDRAPTTLLNVTEGAAKLDGVMAALRDLGLSRWVVCASMVARADGAAEMARTLARASETQAFVATAHAPDDVAATELARWASVSGAEVHAQPDARAAVAQARALAGTEGTVLLIGNGVAHAFARWSDVNGRAR